MSKPAPKRPPPRDLDYDRRPKKKKPARMSEDDDMALDIIRKMFKYCFKLPPPSKSSPLHFLRFFLPDTYGFCVSFSGPIVLLGVTMMTETWKQTLMIS